MSARDGGPAFPREDYQADDAPGQRGMSRRDYFAGQALAGLLAAHAVSDLPTFNKAALASVGYADALLDATEKPRGEQ